MSGDQTSYDQILIGLKWVTIPITFTPPCRVNPK